MPLNAGQRLGPYEVIAPLGAGGMGEVYKARDTRLERTVAVKVLPASLAGDPEFKARFDREARSISALNHPHICTLYDVGETKASATSSDVLSYLVMEYLEGETLADRLKKGPLPVDYAIELASEIADALDKAHRQGIVHRDLKPANVFLVRSVGASGLPRGKLLDFGLAKLGGAVRPGTLETKLLTTPPGSQGQPFDSAQGRPGASAPLTSQGTILGTFQYMAPEQIEGHEADARTDIWAFGCVLYEMLTGRRAFEGKSQASLIASILERQPTPMAELQPMTPPALGRLVRTCLEKNADNRFHTAHDLWLHLQWIEEGGSAAGLPAPVVASRRRRNRLVFAGAAIALAAIAAAGAWALKPAPAVTNVPARFSFQLAEGQAFSRTGRRMIAVSPDGSKIAYIANNQIYLRQLNELDAQPIRGTDLDPLDLVFSPDGREIAFFAAGSAGDLSAASLRKIDVTGGKAIPICPAGPPFGSKWEGDRIIFSLGDRILSVSASGGTPEVLAKTTGTTERLSQPQLVGDGKTLLFTARVGSTFADGQIVVMPLPGGERRVLVSGGMDGRILPSGHLVWARDSTLFAQAIDLSSLQLSGGPVAMIEGIRQAIGTGTAQLGISSNGTLVFAPGSSEQLSDLVWVDHTGREEAIRVPPRTYTYPRVSPDGTKIVMNETDGDGDLWIWDVERRTPTKLTSGPDLENYAVWMPDSKSVVYRSGQSGGQVDLYRRAADGTGTVERLTNTAESESPQMVLAGGQRVLVRVATSDLTAQGRLLLQPLIPDAKPEMAIPALVSTQVSGEVSPDGRWIAYQSPEGSTRDEVHVRPFPDTDAGHWQISSGGGTRPMWSRNSTTALYFVAPGPSRLMRTNVQPARPGGPFLYETPVVVWEFVNYITGFTGRGFDLMPDNRRFLMIKPLGSDNTDRQTLTVMTHWQDELNARVRR